MTSPSFLIPDWPAPAWVRAAATTRQGGNSQAAFAGFNLALHVGDDPGHVAANRRQLRESLSLPAEPAWLDQVHGVRSVRADEESMGCQADAAWTDRAGTVCVVMTADCLPLLLCDDEGRYVAAVHAGWRGLADGIIENTVRSLPVSPDRLMAWLGPAIGPRAFEVGPEVQARFAGDDPANASAFVASPRTGHFYADLYALARQALSRAGVWNVSGGNRCTFSEPETFFSFRRDKTCGRMASLIWLHD